MEPKWNQHRTGIPIHRLMFSEIKAPLVTTQELPTLMSFLLPDKAAKEHNEFKTTKDALVAHFRYLRNMGLKPTI